MAEFLDTEVRLTDEPAGDGARKVVSDLRDGQVALLENLRFDPGEEANEDGFSHTLASYADVYVNDALSLGRMKYLFRGRAAKLAQQSLALRGRSRLLPQQHPEKCSFRYVVSVHRPQGM